MEKSNTRLEKLIKQEGMEKIKSVNIIVFGLGGVGSYSVEALARCFVSKITIVDFDVVSISNINRQIHANTQTIGKKKTELMKERIEKINPDCKVLAINKKLELDNIQDFNLKEYDYVIDAIDSLEQKINLIRYCSMNKIKIISSMGMANKLNPELIQIGKLENTRNCRLARVLRNRLKDTKSALKIPVVFSTEIAKIDKNSTMLGSISFVPSVAGLMLSSYIIRKILETEKK